MGLCSCRWHRNHCRYRCHRRRHHRITAHFSFCLFFSLHFAARSSDVAEHIWYFEASVWLVNAVFWVCRCVVLLGLPSFLAVYMFVFGYRSNAVGYCHISCCQIKIYVARFPFNAHLYLFVRFVYMRCCVVHLCRIHFMRKCLCVSVILHCIVRSMKDPFDNLHAQCIDTHKHIRTHLHISAETILPKHYGGILHFLRNRLIPCWQCSGN